MLEKQGKGETGMKKEKKKKKSHTVICQNNETNILVISQFDKCYNEWI